MGNVTFDVHPLFFFKAGLILGFIAIALGVIIRMFGMREGLLQENSWMQKLRVTPLLEMGSCMGIVMMLGGLFFGFDALMAWGAVGFSVLEPGELLRTISMSTLFIMSGGFTFMVSLIMGFLALPTREQRF